MREYSISNSIKPIAFLFVLTMYIYLCNFVVFAEEINMTQEELYESGVANITGGHVTTRTGTSLTVEWDAISGAEGYDVSYNLVCINNENKKEILNKNITDTSYCISGLTLGTNYIITVKGIINYGEFKVESKEFYTYNTYTNPGKTTSFYVAQRGTNSVKVAWNPVKNAKEYKMYFKEDFSDKWFTCHGWGASDNTYVYNNLKPGTKYGAVVRAGIRVPGENGYGSYVLFADEHVRLYFYTGIGDVSNLKITNKDKTSITTSWDAVEGATQYRVFIKESGKWVQVGSTTSTTYTFKGLREATNYEVAVKGYVNVCDTDVYSNNYTSIVGITNKAEVTNNDNMNNTNNNISNNNNNTSNSGTNVNNTKPNTTTNTNSNINSNSNGSTSTATPGKVSNFKLVSRTSKSIKLSWQKQSNTKGYRLYIKKKGKWVKVVDTAKNYYTVNKLVAGTDYTFAVKAYNKIGKKVVWAKAYPTLKVCTKPAKVTGFKGYAKTKNSISVKWNKQKGASGYRVYIKKNGKWVNVATTSNTKCKIKGLKKNTSYQIAVKSYKKSGKTAVWASSYPVIKYKTK